MRVRVSPAAQQGPPLNIDDLDNLAYLISVAIGVGWRVGQGSKAKQKVRVPQWVKANLNYAGSCLRGLFETDGSVYKDRGYLMAMFVTIIPPLADDVVKMIKDLDFTPHSYKIKQKKPQQDRFNIRVSKDAKNFVKVIGISKV